MECCISLKTFVTSKTPGNDGLVAEFYPASWPVLGKHLVITLLETKGKDEKVLKNGRPISLIIVDTKIAPKVVAKRF